MWEEGYLLKELDRRADALAERKEELEARRKKLQSLRRAVNKKSAPAPPDAAELADAAAAGAASAAVAASAGGGAVAGEASQYSYESEMDLATEAEVIRAHFEQLKRCVRINIEL